jgi:hypothetical protein
MYVWHILCIQFVGVHAAVDVVLDEDAIGRFRPGAPSWTRAASVTFPFPWLSPPGFCLPCARAAAGGWTPRRDAAEGSSPLGVHVKRPGDGMTGGVTGWYVISAGGAFGRPGRGDLSFEPWSAIVVG